MATVINGVPALSAPQIRTGFQVLARSFLAWRAARSRRSAILRELNRLDDRDLRDLGISSYDFTAIANGSLQR